MRTVPYLLPRGFYSEWMVPRVVFFLGFGFAWPIDGFWRGLIRWLHTVVLDELYIPDGTYVRMTEDDGRVPPRTGQKTISIKSPALNSSGYFRRRGVQEYSFFEQYGFKSKK